MSEIINSQKGLESGVPERVSISCPTCGTRHDFTQLLLKPFICQLVNKAFNICDTEVQTCEHEWCTTKNCVCQFDIGLLLSMLWRQAETVSVFLILANPLL